MSASRGGRWFTHNPPVAEPSPVGRSPSTPPGRGTAQYLLTALLEQPRERFAARTEQAIAEMSGVERPPTAVRPCRCRTNHAARHNVDTRCVLGD